MGKTVEAAWLEILSHHPAIFWMTLYRHADLFSLQSFSCPPENP
jgi:hypothetical protein